jgi:hypothetical protein
VRNGRVAKVVSDVDAFRGTAAWSIKRQGKTVDSWAGSYDDSWMVAYMTKVKRGNGESLQASDSLVFVTGKHAASAATKARLKRIGDSLDPPLTVTFKEDFPLLPPPAIAE